MNVKKWKGLDVEAAKRFYDKFGSKQDKQGLYEDHALNKVFELGRFEKSNLVFEVGCGTEHFAERLLREYLPSLLYWYRCKHYNASAFKGTAKTIF